MFKHICAWDILLEDRKDFLNMKTFSDLVFSNLAGHTSASDFSKSEYLCGVII